MPETRFIDVPVALDTKALYDLRVLCSQVGFAIDNYLASRHPPRRCSDCRQLADHQMEDGSWICHHCGAVSFQDTKGEA